MKKQQTTKEYLTSKQGIFVEYYLANGFNAKQAAISAGYSAKSAEAEGSRLLRNDKVLKMLNKAKSEIKTRCGYSQDMLVKELELAQKMAIETQNPSSYIKAVEVKARLLGLNEPEESKVQHTGLEIGKVIFK